MNITLRVYQRCNGNMIHSVFWLEKYPDLTTTFQFNTYLQNGHSININEETKC